MPTSTRRSARIKSRGSDVSQSQETKQDESLRRALCNLTVSSQSNTDTTADTTTIARKKNSNCQASKRATRSTLKQSERVSTAAPKDLKKNLTKNENSTISSSPTGTSKNTSNPIDVNVKENSSFSESSNNNSLNDRNSKKTTTMATTRSSARLRERPATRASTRSSSKKEDIGADADAPAPVVVKKKKKVCAKAKNKAVEKKIPSAAAGEKKSQTKKKVARRAPVAGARTRASTRTSTRTKQAIKERQESEAVEVSEESSASSSTPTVCSSSSSSEEDPSSSHFWSKEDIRSANDAAATTAAADRFSVINAEAVSAEDEDTISSDEIMDDLNRASTEPIDAATKKSNENINTPMPSSSSSSKSTGTIIAIAPRRGGRIRVATKRYIQEETEEDEDASESDEESESEAEVETSIDDESDEDTVDMKWKPDPPDSESDEDMNEEEYEEEDDNGAWSKEAALYDSSLEEEYSESEIDSDMDMMEDSEDEDEMEDGERVGWKSIRHKTTRRTKRKRGSKKKHYPKKLQIRKDIIPLPHPSHAEKLMKLEEIFHKEKGMITVYKFVQCVLWDLDFRFTLLSHQFVGTLAVAGVDVSALKSKLQILKLSSSMEDTEDDNTNIGIDAKGNNHVKNEDMLLLDLEEKGFEYRRGICETLRFSNTKGVLLADDMGLGKTIQGLAGAVLRQGVQSIKSDAEDENDDGKKKIKRNLPSAIVGPNKDVLDQWEETLLKAGVSRCRIKYYHPLRRNGGDGFLLLTRHQLQSDIKNYMEDYESNLYPKIGIQILKGLKAQYASSKGKPGCNEWRERGETESECARKILKMNFKSFGKPIFRTLLIDEAHFLKNLVAYWGLGASLLGMVSERSVPLSGTPYNNGPQDMATLMTFIDPCIRPSSLCWWERATEDRVPGDIRRNVSEWRQTYLIRRDKSVLSVKLPPKIIQKKPVAAYSTELKVYNYYEGTFLKALKEFSQMSDAYNAQQRRRQNDLFQILMACMACMRMCLIHPLVPNGREATIRFSPSRRNLLGKHAKENSQTCVCCAMYLSQKMIEKVENDRKKNGRNTSRTSASAEELAAIVATGGGITEDEQMQDANFEGGATGAKEKNYGTKRSKKDNRKLVKLPSKYCRASSKCPHYIHEECLKQKQEEGDTWTCPKCDDLESRMNLGDDSMSDRPIYCEHIVCGGMKGIRASAKIQAVVKWAQLLPKDDKAIVYSFFKGGLDIVEGIFEEALGIKCARFDGDQKPELRSKELSRFKSSKTCRILLASVQSSGVGLNIVEANHVAFLDRWFNPCVHAQAEDRCHRLKQKKQVNVTYFDTSMTVDEVMASINDLKTNNASILLADGSDIGAGQSGIKFRDLSGTIGDMCNAVATDRNKVECSNPGELFSPIDENVLESASMARELRNSTVEEKPNGSSSIKLVPSNGKDEEAKEVRKIPFPVESSKVSALGISQYPTMNSSGKGASKVSTQRFSQTSVSSVLSDTANAMQPSVLEAKRVTESALVKAKKKTNFLDNISMSLDELEDEDDEDEAIINHTNNSSVLIAGNQVALDNDPAFRAIEAADSYIGYYKKIKPTSINNIHMKSSDEDSIPSTTFGSSSGTLPTRFTGGSSRGNYEDTNQMSTEDGTEDDSSDDESIDLTQEAFCTFPE